MSSTLYEFGYELNSKQVRVYQTHDVGSVHRAITANLQEYLAYEGVQEEDPTSLKNLFVKALTLGVATEVYVLSKFRVSGLLLASSFFFFGILIAFQLTCSFLQRNGDIIFVGTGRLIEGPRPQKRCFRKLKNQRLCVRLTQESMCAPLVKFEFQLIGPSRLFSPPPVYSQVEKSVQYGQFFGSTGFFFPPPLQKLVDGMLEAVVSKKQK
ncbi:conserved hypothetical protein [Leishmania major strain Friedlin]|uniref:Uncharacterized protein n=1 Tax=Leishmania major TaxID=5664 RepID=E9AC23_LEIMA|nr:conserved hypothetical protein [Leishmania major strain Friedlin]CAG9567097.1 hypothetical_protein_-_conserved [Leishmania major strain Friedlin]CBZ11837.1 conserved hypothetical protein [Leishmania major strain Friedlin]|eukprot:XP_003721554.1 conserved hypothetical protein [Leishmania major strain Friedlin]